MVKTQKQVFLYSAIFIAVVLVSFFGSSTSVQATGMGFSFPSLPCLFPFSLFCDSTSSTPVVSASTTSCGTRTFSNSEIYGGAGFLGPDACPGPCMACDGGGWYPDQSSANKLCQVLGYDSAVSFTTQYGFFSSPYNNYFKQGNGSNVCALTSGNAGIDTVTCAKTCDITCSSNSDCGASTATGSPFCQTNSVYQNYTNHVCNNPGTPSSTCNTSTSAQLVANCTGNQVCSNGSCVNIVCSSNSDCGTSGYTGSPFCQSGNVYKNYTTYTCNNPGTSSSTCTNSTNAQLQITCTSNQTCSNGSCVTVACSSSSDCGTNGYTGDPFCQSGNVYKNYRTYTCTNPGTSSSACTNSINAQLFQTCTTNQTCSNGSCMAVACSSSSDCGTNGYIGDPFCQGGNVYKNYKTYTCNNPGTSSSTCTNSTAAQLITTCTGSQACSNGSCSNIACSSNSDCGTNAYTGSPFCQGNGVFQNYITYTCNNAGTANSHCSNSTNAQQKATCTSNQYCTNGNCITNQNDLTVSCYSSPNPANINQSVSFICNVSGGTGSYTYSWSGACTGSSQTCTNTFSSTGTKTATVLVTSGSQTNSASTSVTINQNCTYHSYQQCSGNNLYWYDSCGTQQDLYQYCPNGCYNNSCGQQTGNLTTTQTVRNLTTGSGFASSVAASPGDMLMFMITIQSTGNQNINNIVVRDNLPSNLIYKNQLVVSGTSNYSGDIVSGLNINSIYGNQTITITYQVQVAPAQNFAYGATTLNDNISVTSSNSGYNPVNNASVVVTRGAVYGASTISTGLTNNFWIDSFFLPLLIALIGIWMWRSGIFFGIEKWLDNKRKIRRGYKAEKELNAKITAIRKLGRA